MKRIIDKYNIKLDSLRTIFYQFISNYRIFEKFSNKYKIDLWLMEGKEKNSKTPITVLCSAIDQERSYLATLVFKETYNESYIGRYWLWDINKNADKIGKEYSMMLLDIKKSRRKFLKTDNCFYIPGWVRGVIDLPLSQSTMNKQSLKSDLRKIKKNSLTFEVTQDIKKFDDFYYNMYVPYITNSHANSAYIRSYEYRKKQFEGNELLLIKKDEKYIAGAMIIYPDGSPVLSTLGIRDGNMEYLDSGAMGALYYFSLEYAKKKGFLKISAGMSRGFLKDGVLQYKKKWGHRIIDISSETFALKIISDTPATRAFLENNPFIFDDQGLPCGAVFLNSKENISQELIEQINKDYFYTGLSKLFIYLPSEIEMPNPNVIPLELSERIAFRTLN